MATPVHTASHHLLGTPRRMVAAVVVALAVAVAVAVTAVVLLRSGSAPATTLVDDPPASVGGSAPEVLQDYRYGSADSLERQQG